MGKRAFTRAGGVLRDSYPDPSGQMMWFEFPLSILGEAEVDSQDRVAQRQDPSALLAAARQSPASSLTPVVEALVGLGEGRAVPVLRDRLGELVGDPETRASVPFFNERAGALSAVAAGLLRLDGTDQAAAAALGDLTGHPCLLNRRLAAKAASGLLKDARLSGSVAEALRAGLAKLVDTSDLSLFAAAAPVLVETRGYMVLRRFEEALSGKNPAAREIAIGALLELRGVGGLEVLLNYMLRDPPLPVACRIALSLSTSLPYELRRDTAHRALMAEAPSVRLQGLELLEHVEPDATRAIAMDAAVDEPDPGLLKRLRKFGVGLPD